MESLGRLDSDVFKYRMRLRRKELGMSYEDVAARIEFDRFGWSVVREIELGIRKKNTSDYELRALAAALDCDVLYLTDDAFDPVRMVRPSTEQPEALPAADPPPRTTQTMDSPRTARGEEPPARQADEQSTPKKKRATG